MTVFRRNITSLARRQGDGAQTATSPFPHKTEPSCFLYLYKTRRLLGGASSMAWRIGMASIMTSGGKGGEPSINKRHFAASDGRGGDVGAGWPESIAIEKREEEDDGRACTLCLSVLWHTAHHTCLLRAG